MRALSDGGDQAEMVTLSHAATASGGDYQDLADGGNGTVTTVDTGHGATGAPTSVSV